MRIHFSAEKPCMLRLGGALLGSVGEAEKFADIGQESILAEFLPDDGDLLPLVFRIGEGFFAAPPACADVYRYDCGADVFVRFAPRDTSMRMLVQKRFGDALMTVFSEGKPQLREVFRDAVTGFSCGEKLRVAFAFADIAGHTAERVFRAENGTLAEESYTVHAREGFCPEALHEKLIPFAFFQEILAGGDPAPYLTPALAGRKALLKEYLGDFCGVYLPKEIFYLAHGQINAAGLVYRRAENAFDVRFFEAETDGGKIGNIRPVG